MTMHTLEIIRREHQRLLRIAGAFALAAAAGTDSRSLSLMLAKVERSMLYAFEAEERLLRRLPGAALREHCATHQGIAEGVAAERMRLLNDRRDPSRTLHALDSLVVHLVCDHLCLGEQFGMATANAGRCDVSAAPRAVRTRRDPAVVARVTRLPGSGR